MPVVLETRVPVRHPIFAETDVPKFFHTDHFPKWESMGFVWLEIVTPLSRPLLQTYSAHPNYPLEAYTHREYSLYTLKLHWQEQLGMFDDYRFSFRGKRDRNVLAVQTAFYSEHGDPEVQHHPPRLITTSANLIEVLRGVRPVDDDYPHSHAGVLADWLEDQDHYQQQAKWLRELIAISKLPLDHSFQEAVS